MRNDWNDDSRIRMGKQNCNIQEVYHYKGTNNLSETAATGIFEEVDAETKAIPTKKYDMIEDRGFQKSS